MENKRYVVGAYAHLELNSFNNILYLLVLDHAMLFRFMIERVIKIGGNCLKAGSTLKMNISS